MSLIWRFFWRRGGGGLGVSRCDLFSPSSFFVFALSACHLLWGLSSLLFLCFSGAVLARAF